MSDNVEIVRSEVSSGPTYHFSNYKQLLKALEANGYNEKWGTKDVPETFDQITLTELQLKELVGRLNQAQTCFEQQNLLRIITMNKLKSEIDSITFRNTSELKTAIEQRGIDYPKRYLHQSADSPIVRGFSNYRTLSTAQWEKLITDLKAIDSKNPMADQNRGEIIIATFLIPPGVTTVNQASAAPAESGSLQAQKILVDEPYPSMRDAAQSAMKNAESFPVTIKYSEGGKSYEVLLRTEGGKIYVGEKEIGFALGEKKIARILLVRGGGSEDTIDFLDANGVSVFKVGKALFAQGILPDLISTKEKKVQLFKETGSTYNPRTAITSEMTGSVGSGKSIATPQVEKVVSGKELKDFILAEAKKEIESINGNFDTLSLEEIERAISMYSSFTEMKWIEKIPGMKERMSGVLKMDIAMDGMMGAGFITLLERQGYVLGFNGKNKLTVSNVKGRTDSAAVESKINMHLAKDPKFVRMLKTGIIYKQPAFEEYRQSVTDNDGNLIAPEKVTLQNYMEFLKNKGTQRNSREERAFLFSSGFFKDDVNFAGIVAQGGDFRKSVEMMVSMTGDDSMRRILGSQNGRAAYAPELAAGAPDRGGSSGAVGEVAKTVGKLGGLIGTVAEAGVGGGMKVLSEIFQEANKAGGAYGTLAVIGLIGYSMFGKRGLGFWGTLAAIFGIGVADSVANGKLKGILGGGAPAGSPATPGAGPTNGGAGADVPPPPDVAPQAPRAARGGTDTPPETPRRALTKSSLIARAMGKDDIDTADVAPESAIIDAVSKMNYVKLDKALITGVRADIDAAIASTGIAAKTTEYAALMEALGQKNIKVVRQMMDHLRANPFVNGVPADRVGGMTLGQMIDYVVKAENNHEENTPNQLLAPPSEVFTMSDGHSNLYLLSRLLTQGYIPQLNNIKAGDIKASDEAFYKKFWSTAKYFYNGAFLTNNDRTKNPLVGKLHDKFDQKFADFALVAVKDEDKMVKEAVAAMKGKFPNGGGEVIKAELLDRKAKVDALEGILSKSPIDENALKSALKAYEASVKTKWEVIGNTLGMKWGANGWRVFKSVDAGAYVTKGQTIVNEFRSGLSLEEVKDAAHYRTLIEAEARAVSAGTQSTKIFSIGDKHFVITGVEADGKIKLAEWDITAQSLKANGTARTVEKEGLIAEVYGKYRSEVLEKHKDTITATAERLGAEIDAKKATALSAFEAWEQAPKDGAKKAAAMAALEDYNKLVTESSGKLSKGLMLLSEGDARALASKTKTGSWLGDMINTNLTGKNFAVVDRVGKFVGETPYLKGAHRGFIGVGLLTIAYNSGGGLADLVRDGKIGTAMTRLLDLGIGMVPVVGSIHDLAILTFEDYEKWMLGTRLTSEEREMRKLMITLGVIPGVGMAVKGVGNVAKSGMLLAGGSVIMKSGNLLRSVASYTMLGMSIYHTTFEISKKYQ